jgi:hypothetical protein
MYSLEAFPKYGLYVYGEGKMAGYLEKGKFSGIPVLFIPGNSGSHKQVRSLASVALRHFILGQHWKPVLGIRDILVRIRIPGSVPLTNGSGPGSGSPNSFFIDF